MNIENLCLPVILNILLVIAYLIVNLINRNWSTSIKNFITGLIFTSILQLLCVYKYIKLAWVIFLIPLFIFIILNVILVTIFKKYQTILDNEL